MKRTLTVLIVTTLLAVTTTACGGGGSGTIGGGRGSKVKPGSATTSAGGDDHLGRVVALGEEFLLTDLLSLGVKPVASTATVAEAGFQGMDDFDTSGIKVLANTEQNVEELADLHPDTIVAQQYVIDEVGSDTLSRLGKLIVAPNGSGPKELTQLGKSLGREDQAAGLITKLNAAKAKAKAGAPANCKVSVGTIYVGPTPAAWIAAPNNVAAALDDMGCTLVPSADDEKADQAGRVYLSMEQIGRLSAPILILQQTKTVEGEDQALKQVESSPLWKQLPAVKADHVVVLDRLGYPGVDGLIRLYAKLATIVS